MLKLLKLLIDGRLLTEWAELVLTVIGLSALGILMMSWR